MLRRWLVYLALCAAACSEPKGKDCSNPDYSICGAPLGELDGDGKPWRSYSEDLVEICNDPSFFETSLGECEDGKRVLSRSWGFGGDVRFYEGEVLVGRRAGGDLLFIEADSPKCICAGESFQGSTLESVHCQVTSAEELCGHLHASLIENATLEFDPIFAMPLECGCSQSPAAAP